MRRTRLTPFLSDLYTALAVNPVIDPRKLIAQFFNNVPLMKGVAKRKNLLDEVYIEELLVFEDDDIMAAILGSQICFLASNGPQKTTEINSTGIQCYWTTCSLVSLEEAS